jgi:hypothetical protein
LGNKFTLRPTTQALELFSFNKICLIFFKKKGKKRKEIILKTSSVNCTNFAFFLSEIFFVLKKNKEFDGTFGNIPIICGNGILKMNE